MPRWKPKILPSREEILRVLDYDPSTGVLRWKYREPTSSAIKTFNTLHAGRPAAGTGPGRKDNQYINVRILGTYYLAHRVIWKIMTGQEPPEFIDHEDGDNFNNRWKNFREASNGKNQQNAKLRKDNSSGVKGVAWDGWHQKWRVVISVDKVSHRLGRFDTVAQAAEVANAKRIELHGAFARMR